MLVKEYRILLPLTVEEYRIAQLYMIQKKSRLESSGTGSGVEIIKNEPYELETGESGQYTLKIYHISNRIPAWIRSLLSTGALDAHEHSWNAYPLTRTLYTCQLLERFRVDVETRYLDDAGTQNNVFNLSEEELQKREVDVIDFVNDPVSDYCVEEDPKLFHSRKTSRGPLTENWLEECKREGRPVMCAYKICRVEFRYWGLQTRAEQWIHDLALRKTMLHAHRQAWAWQDEWVDLTMKDIRRLEAEAAQYLSGVMSESNGDNSNASTINNSSQLVEKPRNKKDKNGWHRNHHRHDVSDICLNTTEKKDAAQNHVGNSTPNSNANGETTSANTGGTGTSDEVDDEDVIFPRTSGKSKPSTNSSEGNDDRSESEDVFFDCSDHPTTSTKYVSKSKPALIRWSSELLLEPGDEEDHCPLADTPRPNPNSSLLILVFHGDLYPDHPADTKTTDAAALYSTLEQIVRNHYPQLNGRVRVLQISCGRELAATFEMLIGINSYFNIFHPSFALLLTAHRTTFKEAVQNTIQSANHVLETFLRTDEGVKFQDGEIFVVGDYVGGLLMYEAMAPGEHRIVSRNPSAMSAENTENKASTCSLFDYNIDDGATMGPNDPSLQSLFSQSLNGVTNSPRQHLHKTVAHVVSWDPKKSSRNLSAPPSAGFRSSTTLALTSTSSSIDTNDTSQDPSTPKGNSLSFTPNAAFLLGCPLALFLTQRKLAGLAISDFKCGQLYNIYYPSDLCAGRLEPVLNLRLATLPPLMVPRYQRSWLSGSVAGRQFFFDNTFETPTLWGCHRVDYELYCPNEMTTLRSAVFPRVLHASYWESKDVGDFILRQFIRADMSTSPNIHITSNKPDFLEQELPPRMWNRRRTKYKLAHLSATHRANDVTIVEGAVEQTQIQARFCYMDIVDLSLENVLVFVRSMNGDWMLNSKEVTDGSGRLTTHLKFPLAVGLYEMRMVVQGDRTFLNLSVAVVPRGTECVVFSIDGSLTNSVSVTGRDPRVKPSAVDVVRFWQKQGYLIIYVTARPDMQQRVVAHWLMRHNFPHGLLNFIQSISTDPLKQKAQILRQVVDDKLRICAAYGSAKDVSVYASVGVESGRIFRCGSSRKRQDCVSLDEDGYSRHVHELLSGEVSIARPAGGTTEGEAINLFVQQQRERNDSFIPRCGKYHTVTSKSCDLKH